VRSMTLLALAAGFAVAAIGIVLITPSQGTHAILAIVGTIMLGLMAACGIGAGVQYYRGR